MLKFNFNPFPEIRTERLRLGNLTTADDEALYLLRSNPKVLTYLDRHPEKSVSETHSLIHNIHKGIEANESILWGLYYQKSNLLIGTIGLWNLDPTHHRAEIGYLLRPEYWGHGLMNESMSTILNYGFGTMHLHSIEAKLNPNNQASKNLLLRFGFETEGYFKENYFFNGRFLDTEVMSLIYKPEKINLAHRDPT